jgi:hypothetical protein
MVGVLAKTRFQVYVVVMGWGDVGLVVRATVEGPQLMSDQT